MSYLRLVDVVPFTSTSGPDGERFACPMCPRVLRASWAAAQHYRAAHIEGRCGTEAGHKLHRRAGERPCESCRRAHCLAVSVSYYRRRAAR